MEAQVWQNVLRTQRMKSLRPYLLIGLSVLALDAIVWRVRTLNAQPTPAPSVTDSPTATPGFAAPSAPRNASPSAGNPAADPIVGSTLPPTTLQPTATALPPSDSLTAEQRAKCDKPFTKRPPKPVLPQLLAIGVLLVVIAFVVRMLPKPSVQHTPTFRRRRILNWLPLGLTYAFLYMARYNVNSYMDIGRISAAEFGTLFAVGSLVYGLSFFLNGPLTDRWGGRTTILLAAGGVAITNVLLGYMEATNTWPSDRLATITVMYGINMYFQSFGAVSIVKVNQAWFNVRERGTFGGIFGILISLGIFFAYDGGRMISDYLPTHYLFFVPAGLLLLFALIDYLLVFDRPSAAGLPDIDTDDAEITDGDVSPTTVIWRVLSNPVVMTVAVIELCSGFLRQAILQWGREFGKGIGLSSAFVFENWGVVSAIAGIVGGMFAGAISDHLFHSRRGPVSAVLYGIMLIGAVAIIPLFGAPAIIPWVVAFMAMAIIGVHGMLTGTMSQDFGGKRATGIVVGVIDGFVYFGSTLQSWFYGKYLPSKLPCPNGRYIDNPAAKDISNWHVWPYAMIPVAAIGLLLAFKLWNAKPGARSGGH